VNLTFVVIDVTCEKCGHTYTKDRLGHSSTGFPAPLTHQCFSHLEANGAKITHKLHLTEYQPFCHRCLDTSHLISINSIQETIVRAPPRSERKPLTSYSQRKPAAPAPSTKSVLYD
jgi:hypothetical protein